MKIMWVLSRCTICIICRRLKLISVVSDQAEPFKGGPRLCQFIKNRFQNFTKLLGNGNTTTVLDMSTHVIKVALLLWLAARLHWRSIWIRFGGLEVVFGLASSAASLLCYSVPCVPGATARAYRCFHRTYRKPSKSTLRPHASTCGIVLGSRSRKNSDCTNAILFSFFYLISFLCALRGGTQSSPSFTPADLTLRNSALLLPVSHSDEASTAPRQTSHWALRSATC